MVFDEPRSTNARTVDLLRGIDLEQALYIVERLGFSEREHLLQALKKLHLGDVFPEGDI